MRTFGALGGGGGNPTYALNCAFVFRTAHGAHARRDARQVPLRDITSSHGVPGRVRLSPMLYRRCQGFGTHPPPRGLARRLAARCGLPPLTLTGLLGAWSRTRVTGFSRPPRRIPASLDDLLSSVPQVVVITGT